ncbi:porin [Moraxella pluranimalium]|uniref:Porin domain-containing protein n=1 Tax=Moraxella pluranimalium TaxID=470453 RepID=A0A1T0CMY7_9GAMM|nr:porin [Moraxella pluranimalium]OOS23673.1 hypothetical protein B0680_06900 [Moraxella pluranimalium]
MKKLVLATAIAALSVTAAQAAPTVYGKAFLTLDTTTSKTEGQERVDGRTQLNSNASRIGVKGSEALTANTDVVYKLEYRVEVDDNTRTFEARDAYLGLANKQYGTLLAGRLTAIDGRVDYANVTTGGVIGYAEVEGAAAAATHGADGVLASFDAERVNNAIAYVSPTYNGLTASAMYVMDENASTDTLNGDAYGVAVQYEPANQPFRAGASYISASNALSGEPLKAVRVSGAFDATPALTIGALYQNTDLNTNDNENTFTVSGKYKTQTPWTTYGQVDVVTNAKGVKDDEAQRYVVGGKYAFNKSATGHVYGAFLNQSNAANVDTKSFGIGTGLEYNF